MDENNLHCSVMKVLCCAIGFCKETSEQRMKTFFYLNNMQPTETRTQRVNELKLTVVGFTAGQKHVENQDWAAGRGSAFSKTRLHIVHTATIENAYGCHRNIENTVHTGDISLSTLV